MYIPFAMFSASRKPLQGAESMARVALIVWKCLLPKLKCKRVKNNYFCFQLEDLKKLQEALIHCKPHKPDLCSELKDKYTPRLKLNQSFERPDELRQDRPLFFVF